MRTTETFGEWWDTLSVTQRTAIIARIDMLKESGPTLGRPLVDRIEGSRHHNMKELRVKKEGELRVLFAFDPVQQAVLLVGGDKTGQWDKWYREMIPVADDLLDQHLEQLREQGT